MKREKVTIILSVIGLCLTGLFVCDVLDKDYTRAALHSVAAYAMYFLMKINKEKDDSIF